MSGRLSYETKFEQAFAAYGFELALDRQEFAKLDLDLSSSYLGDLVLARSCAAGNAIAWQRFVDRYKNKLNAFALSLTHDTGTACELADSLYSLLYAAPQKLQSYSGRGPLESWLRVVLAQQHVNEIRRQRRLVPLHEEEAASAPEHGCANDVLSRAVDLAFCSIDADCAFLLSAYFLDGRTLAEIGRILGVHESSVSRRLDKATASLRKRILKELQKLGISRSAAEEMLHADVRDLQVDLRAHLAQNLAQDLAQEKEQDAFL